MNYKYPLQTDNFNFLDRIRAALFILNKKNRLTTGPKTEQLEKEWEHIAAYNSGIACLATSSGSTANHLLVETFLQVYNYKPENITVFIPSTTWASSATPWIMRGCEVVFIDINLEDFSFNYEELRSELENRKNDKKIKVIWPTALIGFIPDIDKLKSIQKQYNTYLFADLCETTLGFYKDFNILECFDMATTSFFWAHEFTSIEGGMLFIKKDLQNFESIYEGAKMIRSHGLTRVLHKYNFNRQRIERLNSHIDPEFLFEKIGTNYRLTDIHAFFGLLDTKRYYKYIKHRRKLWSYFIDNMPNNYEKLNQDIIPFCLPIISKKLDIKQTKEKLNKNGWETRPIISFLPINPAFIKFNKRSYPNSDYLHNHGFYVGLNKDLKISDLEKLINLL